MTRLLNLHRALPACAMALAAAACGSDGIPGPEGQTSEPAARLSAAGHLGSVTYRYDAAILKPASVRITLPPSEEAPVYGVKLLPARGVDGAMALCPVGEPTCSVEAQPGVTLALLERPFARYQEALRASDLAAGVRPATIADAAAISVAASPEDGLEVEYRLAPVGERALLIKLQSDGQHPAEDEALEDVIASIDLGD